MTFVVAHIDALITVMIGFALLVSGRRVYHQNPQSSVYLQRAAIVLIAIGALLMMTTRSSTPKPVVQATDNGVATASFPGQPKRTLLSASETPDGADRETYDFRPPGHDLSYKLSRSSMTGDLLGMSDSERIEGLVAHFQSQKYVISNHATVEKNGVRIHSFQFAMPGVQAVSTIRIAFVGDQIYRVIASSGNGESAESEFETFLASFNVRPIDSN